MSIYQRSNGKWAATLPNNMGRKYLGSYDTRAEAASVRDAAIAELHMRGFSPDTNAMTLDKLRVAFFKQRQLNGVRGLRQEMNRWSTHISTWRLARVDLAVITPSDVRELRNHLMTTLANQSVKNTLSLLRAAFAFAVESGMVETNPCVGIAVKRRETRTDRPWTFLTPDEQERLIAVASPRDRALITFALGTGMRLGELLALRAEDVTTDSVTVRFGAPGKPTKSGHIRTVPLLGRAAEVAPHRTSVLFFGPRARINSRDWNKYLRAAGINRTVRFHDLRHTCATAMVSGWFGVEFTLEDVREMLGHSTIKLTERYAHQTGAALHNRAMRLQQVATGSSAPNTDRTCGLRFRKPAAGSNLAEITPSGCNLLQLAQDVLTAFAENSPSAVRLAIELAESVLSVPSTKERTG